MNILEQYCEVVKKEPITSFPGNSSDYHFFGMRRNPVTGMILEYYGGTRWNRPCVTVQETVDGKCVGLEFIVNKKYLEFTHYDSDGQPHGLAYTHYRYPEDQVYRLYDRGTLVEHAVDCEFEFNDERTKSQCDLMQKCKEFMYQLPSFRVDQDGNLLG